MKKLISTILCAAMIISGASALVSCNKADDTSTTTADAAKTTAATTTATVTTTKAPDDPVTPPTTEPKTTTVEPELILGDQEWHYKVFSCPYSATGPNGVYDEDLDEFEAYFRDKSWDHDAANIPDGLIDEMKEWPTAAAPFGDGDSYVDHSDIGWTGDNHGLIIYTTFKIDDLAAFKNAYDTIEIFTWFDNTPTFYLNGKLIFRMDTNCTANPADWVDSVTLLDLSDNEYAGEGIESNADLIDLLVEGENTFVIVLKDAWGGRELQFDMNGAKSE